MIKLNELMNGVKKSMNMNGNSSLVGHLLIIVATGATQAKRHTHRPSQQKNHFFTSLIHSNERQPIIEQEEKGGGRMLLNTFPCKVFSSNFEQRESWPPPQQARGSVMQGSKDADLDVQHLTKSRRRTSFL